MKQFYTVVLDRLTDFSGRLLSEPYEAGWADEAIAFIRIHEAEPSDHIHAWIQISPDGIEWMDEGHHIECAGVNSLHCIRISNFGGWLRLCLESERNCKVTTYFALKG